VPVTTPVVTLGVTCYNARETISRALLSALCQSGPEREILVVDDASTDGSSEFLARWMKCVPALRVIERSQNGGAGAARNTLLEHARGEYIVFFDDDDVSEPTRVECQLDAIRRCERAAPHLNGVVCNTARLRRWSNGYAKHEHTVANADGDWTSPRRLLDLVFLGRPVAGRLGACPTCSQAARAQLYRVAGGFDETLRRGEDTDMNIRLARAGAAFHGIDEPLVHQAVTVGEDKGVEYEERAALRWVSKHRPYLEEEGIYGFVAGWFRFKFDLLRRRRLAAACQLIWLSLRYPALLARRGRDYRAARKLKHHEVVRHA